MREDVALITGARRGKERDELAKKETFRAFTYRDGKRDLPEDGRTRYLICTAAGEVGADLDADAAVMDLVPLERMIQRLGRVNRRGECAGSAPVVIHYEPAALKVLASDKKEEKKAEAERLTATKAALEALPKLDGGFDASPVHLAALDPNARRAASSPPPEIPVIEREHVEAWALTSLKDHPGRPEADPFLRGIVDEEPQTTVAWRADVTCLARFPARSIEQALTAARLMPAETLEAPTREIAQFLQRRVKALQKSWKQERESGEEPRTSVRLLVLKRGRVIGYGKITGESATLQLHNAEEGAAELPLDGDLKDIQGALSHTTVLFEPAFGGLDKDGALDAIEDERDGLHVQPEDQDAQEGLVIRLVPPQTEDGDAQVRLLTVPPAFRNETAALRHYGIAPAVRRRLGLRRAWFAELPPKSENPDDEADARILEALGH